MKKIILTMAAFALMAMTAMTATAQEAEQEKEKEISTIFGGEGEKFSTSGYGGPSIKFSQIDGDLAILVGGKGAWTVNKRFSIGLAGYGLVTWPEITHYDNILETDVDYDFMFGYGGLYLEYIHQPYDVIHFSANTLIGFGGASLENINSMDNDNYLAGEAWGAYFILEPSLAVELNVSKFLRIQLEAGYRYVDEIRSNDKYDDVMKDKDMKLSGISGGITFQIGKF